jgi:VCBS repeat protein
MRPQLALCLLVFSFQASRPPDLPLKTHLIDPGASETAAVADINRDGRLDIVSGEHWYEAPAWTKHRFRELGFSNQYIDNFSDLAVDVDGDLYPDIVSVSWFAKKVAWWRNPGKAGGSWTEAPINSGFNVEFAILADLDNDGKANEVVAQENGTGQAWYEARSGTWVRHAVSDRTYGHGIGAGDVNGDKRTDILTPRGWLEAPAEPRSGNWTFHLVWEASNLPATPAPTPPKPGAPPRVSELGFMHVLDVNGDGRNDVVTAAGHDYGVYWFEQGPPGPAGQEVQWTRRTIDSAWSQGHASTLVDINGDGRLDLVTGKRFMAHNGADPGEREPLGVYWYEVRPQGTAGNVEWVRHLVDYGGRMGAGMQVPVTDIDGDGDLDLVCPGKSGLFLVENLTTRPGSAGK